MIPHFIIFASKPCSISLKKTKPQQTKQNKMYVLYKYLRDNVIKT